MALPVRDHGSPSVLLGQQMCVDGLGDGADLVYLQEEAVASLLFHGSRDALGVGHLTQRVLVNRY